MDVNYIIIIGSGILAMVIGSIWYGPLFGKKWTEIIGATALDIEKRKEMQKKALPLYITQFVLTLLQVYILGNLIQWTGGSTEAIWIAAFMWLGFVIPTLAGSAMWNNNPTKVKWAMFLIQGGYQLVMFLCYGFLFTL